MLGVDVTGFMFDENVRRARRRRDSLKMLGASGRDRAMCGEGRNLCGCGRESRGGKDGNWGLGGPPGLCWIWPIGVVTTDSEYPQIKIEICGFSEFVTNVHYLATAMESQPLDIIATAWSPASRNVHDAIL